jgi:plastocyanin
MEIRFSRIYVIIHLFAVLALFVSPFVFFNVYADTQNEWKVTIPDGASDQDIVQGFYPNELPVLVGDVIVWENKDNVNHSITSGLPQHPDDSGLFFNLGEIKPGESISYEFKNSDYSAFYYFCEIHPWMTGKFFLSNLEMAKSETDIPIALEKQAYSYGEEILVSGQVHKDFEGTKYSTLIYDQNNVLVDFSNGFFDGDGSYLQTIQAKGSTWDMNGNYQIKLVYAVPSKVATTNFQFSNNFITNENSQVIPDWIKNVGDYWCNGQIDDSEFINAVQYLIKKEVIELKNTVSDTFSNQVPEWVKNNACWWSDDKIPDVDFIFGIEYLVNIGTIRV